MFKMRKEQKDAFREEALRGFEERVMAHWARCFAERRAALDDAGARGLVRQGIERAAALGVVAERDVCNLLDLMLVFGPDFDRERGWAKDVLARTAGATPQARVRDLYARAMEEA